MNLKFIVTLANKRVRLRFLAMERSLRAVGCDLPLRVIPYDDDRFDLPTGATWWEDAPLFDFLASHHAHPTMRKYLCLTSADYQFVDSDIVFVRNPIEVLRPTSGWITSCGAWRSNRHTLTPELSNVLQERTTLTQLQLFNSGQFACDRVLYNTEKLKSIVTDSRYSPTALTLPYHEQPGVNLLVQLSNVPVTNITLPPHKMESTWAGDYLGNDFAKHWTKPEKTPYLIHWAGCNDRVDCPIDQLYLQHFSPSEREEWEGEIIARKDKGSLLRRGRHLAYNTFNAGREFVSVLSTGKTRDQRS